MTKKTKLDTIYSKSNVLELFCILFVPQKRRDLLNPYKQEDIEDWLLSVSESNWYKQTNNKHPLNTY